MYIVILHLINFYCLTTFLKQYLYLFKGAVVRQSQPLYYGTEVA
jgi:hypothetical protein